MMKHLLIFTICLFSFALAKGQESKTITYNKEPLENVIKDLQDVFKIKFSYSPEILESETLYFNNKKYSLDNIIRAIEAQTNIKIEKLSKRYYILNLRKENDKYVTQELDEVLLEEYLTSGIRKNHNSAIVLSPKKLGILPGLTEPDILQSLQLLPGIQSPTETASGLYIRGGTPDQNLILWDGIKMYHSGHFFGLISAFNPYIIDDALLYKSGTKARYGNRISGVIDITSTNRIPSRTEMGIGLNMTHTDIYLKTPVHETLAIVMSARRSFKDVFDTFTFKNLSDRVFQNTRVSEGNKIFEDDQVRNTGDFFNFWDITTKAIYKPSDKNELLISSIFTTNKLDYSYLIEEFDEATKDELEINNQGFSVKWNHRYNDKLSQSITSYYSNYNLNYIESNDFSDLFSSEASKRNGIKDYGFLLDLNMKLNSKNTLGFGYHFSSAEVDYAFNYSDNDNQTFNETDTNNNNINAIYADYQYDNQNNLILNVGIRSNYVSVLKKFFLEPRLQCEIGVNSNFKLQASFEQLNQSLSQIVEFNTQNFGLENQIWAVANNDNIPNLRSNQVSFGFNFIKNDWSIDLGFYLKKISGLTSLINGFDNFQNVTISQGKSNILGLDFLLKKKLYNYRTWLSYSAMRNNFIFDEINNGQNFPGNFQISHQLGWSHTYKFNRFDFSLGWVFRTGTPFTEAIELNEEGVIVYGQINKEKQPNYHHLDFSTTYKFDITGSGKIKGKLGFSLFNIYNNKNLLNTRYRVRQDSEEGAFLQKVENVGLGISPNLLFRIDF